MQKHTRSVELETENEKNDGGQSGRRTRTGVASHRILSPVRLPISPSGRWTSNC